MMHRWATISILTSICVLAGAEPAYASELRLGIIGTDSSHSVEFTRILSDLQAVDHVDGAHVVAAYRGGNPQLALSRDRIDRFTTQLQSRWNVPFVTHIEELCPLVDGLLLLSVDPVLHQAEFKEAARCGKPIFVDKPFAPTLQAAEAMASYATQKHIVWFSASAMRYGSVQQLCGDDVRGADVWGPGALGEGYPLDLAWYGIHSIEMLYGVMGPGVRSVSRVHTADSDVITAIWHDGRIGTIHIVRPDMSFGITVLHATGTATARSDIPVSYSDLLQAIVIFMHTSHAPVSAEETLEVFAFMDAAQRSMNRGGAPVSIAQATSTRRPR